MRLSAERQALVDKLLSDTEGATPPRDGPLSLARGGELPLSFAEERTWLLERFQPGVPWRHLHVALRLQGDLKTADLRESANEVIRRHEILRTRYAEIEGHPRRVIDSSVVVDLPLQDLPKQADGPCPRETETILRKHAESAFDLARGPLVRILLLRLSDGDHILSVAVHQMICDGPSLRILLSEVFALYEGRVRGTVLNLPLLPIQYADFAVWQRSHRQAMVLEQDLAYWRAEFDPPVTELRLGVPPSASGSPTQRCSVLSSTLGESRLTALKRLANDRDATLFMVLLAAFQVLLSRHSGVKDFLIGIPASHRSHPETERLIGSFANILPLRADLNGDPTFQALIERVRTVTIEAFSHSEAPYERISEEVRLPRLTTMMLVHEPLRAGGESSLRISGLPLGRRETPYDIHLSFLESDTALLASIEYRDSLFSDEEARLLLADLDRILTALVERPTSRLSALPTAGTAKISAAEVPPARRVPDSHSRSGGAPSDRLERELAALWEAVLGIRPMGVRHDFFALGGTSLSAVRLFLLIERALGKRLPLSVLLEAPTVEKLAVVLRQEGFSRRWSCLVPIQASGSKPPFFCVHGAGGNVLFLRNLARHMGRQQPLYGLQAAGLDGSTPPLTTVEEMARLYLDELKTVQPHGPYYLGGYCFGAYAALEMAQRLRREGEQVAFLASFNETGAWRTVGSVGDAVNFHRHALSRLSGGRKLAYVCERVSYRAARVTSAALGVLGRIYRGGNRAAPSRLGQFHVEKTTHAAGMRYKPRPYEGRFALFRSETIADPRGNAFWRRIVRGDIESHVFPGGENKLFEELTAELLAERLADCLERARSASEGPKESDDAGGRALQAYTPALSG